MKNILGNLRKLLRRIGRVVSGRAGVYGRLGKDNRIQGPVFYHELSEIGSHNYLGPYSMALNAKIGNYCSIGPGVKLGQSEHDLRCVSTSTKIFGPAHGVTAFSGRLAPAIIENDVWLAANVVVRQGVTVHTGAVVGAGAVVTKDVPPYAVVAGVPARILRYRFDEASRDLLLASRWWELSPDEAVSKCKSLQEQVVCT